MDYRYKIQKKIKCGMEIFFVELRLDGLLVDSATHMSHGGAVTWAIKAARGK